MKGQFSKNHSYGPNITDLDPKLFAAWIEQSPENVRDYLREVAITFELEKLDAEHSFDLHAVVARAKADLAEIDNEPD